MNAPLFHAAGVEDTLGWDPRKDNPVSRWDQIIHAAKLVSTKGDDAATLQRLTRALAQDGDALRRYTNKAKWLGKGGKYAGRELSGAPPARDDCISIEADCLALLEALNAVDEPSCISDFLYFTSNNHLIISMLTAEAANPLSRVSRCMVGGTYLMWHLLGNWAIHDMTATDPLDGLMLFYMKFMIINLPAGFIAKNGIGFMLGCPCLVGSTGSCSDLIRKVGQGIAKVFLGATCLIVVFWFGVIFLWLNHDITESVHDFGPHAAEITDLQQKAFNQSYPSYDSTLKDKIVGCGTNSYDCAIIYWCEQKRSAGEDNIDLWQCHVVPSMLLLSLQSILVSEIKWFFKQILVGFNPMCHGKCTFGGWNAEREQLVKMLEQVTGKTTAADTP
eukprot:COSAG01_NODE_3120_length_6556_cov_11.331578_3_plen_389_part_00